MAEQVKPKGTIDIDALLAVFLLVAFAGLVILLWRRGIAKIKRHLEKDGLEPVSNHQNLGHYFGLTASDKPDKPQK